MSDDLDLMQLARGGDLFARVDDTDYRAVHIVFAWPAGGVPRVYCAAADWVRTPAARLDSKDREIAELLTLAESRAHEVVRLAALVASLEAQPKETPAQNQANMFVKQATALDDPVGACPDCDKAGWKSARALQMHRRRAHLDMQTVQAVQAPPVQFAEELGWHCAAKGCASAHTRDLHDPLFCTLHAQCQIANGVQVAP